MGAETPLQTREEEKSDVSLGESGRDDSLGSNRRQAATCPPHTTEQALLRRLDARLVPVVILLYLWSFLDRINISNAITLGLQARLGLRGDDINAALAVFFAPYILFEIPSNILLRRFKPHNWLAGSMVLFGIIVLCHGFVTSFGGLLAARFFLGLAEAGIMPGCSYLLTMWYKPSEALRRYSIYLNSVTLAGAFGSLLASGIAKMDGIRGYAGWQWIFILEGIVTVLVGIVAYFLIPDFPEDARWLTREEADYMQARLMEDEPMEEHNHSWTSALKRYFSDYKAYIAALLYFGCNIVGYSVSYFLPTIVRGFHYSRIQTQLHSVPPFAAAWAWSIFLGYVSAKARHRMGFALFSFALTFTGLGILFNVHNNSRVEYAAVFLVVMGLFGGLPIVLVWYFMNLKGHTQRSLGTAWVIGFGNIGGIVATFSFQASDAPRYHKGYSILTFGMSLGAACTIAYRLALFFDARKLRNLA